MTPNKLIAAAFASAAAVLIPLSAEATLARAATFDDKVENAQSIILGKCLKTHADWDASHRWILTYATFQVEKSLKGGAASEVTLVTPGGEVGGLHQDTIGVPAFRAGDENVIFIRDSKVGPTVLYFDQGAYDVTKNDRGERVVQPVPSDLVRVDTQRGTAVAPESPRTLAQFQSDVESTLKRQAFNRMELIREKQKREQEKSLGSVILKNKLLIAVALAGLALAAWQLARRQ